MQPHDTLQQIEGYKTAKDGLRGTTITLFLAKNANREILEKAHEVIKKISKLLSNGFKGLKDSDVFLKELQEDLERVHLCISIMGVHTRGDELFTKAVKKLLIITMALGYFTIPAPDIA